MYVYINVEIKLENVSFVSYDFKYRLLLFVYSFRNCKSTTLYVMKRSYDNAFNSSRGKTSNKRAKTTNSKPRAKSASSGSESKATGLRAQKQKATKTDQHGNLDSRHNGVATMTGTSPNQSLKGVWICARLETLDASTVVDEAKVRDVLVSANDRGRIVVNSNDKCRVRFYGSKQVYEYSQRRVIAIAMPDVSAAEHINMPTFRDVAEFALAHNNKILHVDKTRQDAKEAVHKAKKIGMSMANNSSIAALSLSLSSSKPARRTSRFIDLPKVLTLVVAGMLFDLELIFMARTCRNWNSMLTKRLTDRKRDSLFEITRIHQIPYIDSLNYKTNRLILHGDFATRLPRVIDTHGQELLYMHKESLYLAYHASGYVRCISSKTGRETMFYDMNALRTKENTQTVVSEPVLFTDAGIINKLFPDSGHRHVIHVTINALPGKQPRIMSTEVLMTVESVVQLLKRLAPGYGIKELDNQVDYKIVPIEELNESSDGDDSDDSDDSSDEDVDSSDRD